ncbi:hypothetical protein LCGC14_3012780, partial [marine sediment metagenome]
MSACTSAERVPFTTYAPMPEGADDLQQGDIIQPDDEIAAVLEQVHEHFSGGRYTAFIVLTQT